MAAWGFSLAACRVFNCGTWDLVPWPGIKPGPPTLGTQNLKPLYHQRSSIKGVIIVTKLALRSLLSFPRLCKKWLQYKLNTQFYTVATKILWFGQKGEPFSWGLELCSHFLPPCQEWNSDQKARSWGQWPALKGICGRCLLWI